MRVLSLVITLAFFVNNLPAQTSGEKRTNSDTYHTIAVDNYDGKYIAQVYVTVHYLDGTKDSYKIDDLEGIDKPGWDVEAMNVAFVHYYAKIRSSYAWDPIKVVYDNTVDASTKFPNFRLSLGGTYDSPAVGAFAEQ